LTSRATAWSTGPASDVLASEWIKFRAVRSTCWLLVFAAVSALALSVVVASALAAAPAPAGRGGQPVDPMLPGFASLEYAVLAVGVLGVRTVTSEYSSGLIRVTLTAVPQRGLLLTAKAAVVGVTALVLGELVSFISFFIVQATLSGKHLGVSLSRPGAAGGVLAEGVLLAVCALAGVGVGVIVRRTAGALATLAGVIFLPAVLGLLPAPWNDRLGRFTLLDAAHQVVTLRPSATLFSPAISMLVLLAWPAAVLAAGAVLISRRDV
jgi:ABC-2 type transport system permease protein